jgi:hypothetical protein
MAEIEFSARFRCKSSGGRREANEWEGLYRKIPGGFPQGLPAQR